MVQVMASRWRLRPRFTLPHTLEYENEACRMETYVKLCRSKQWQVCGGPGAGSPCRTRCSSTPTWPRFEALINRTKQSAALEFTSSHTSLQYAELKRFWSRFRTRRRGTRTRSHAEIAVKRAKGNGAGLWRRRAEVRQGLRLRSGKRCLRTHALGNAVPQLRLHHVEDEVLRRP